MADQKIDNLLNLAMDATPQERRKSGNLNVGYDPATRLWDGQWQSISVLEIIMDPSIVNAMGDCKWKRFLPLWGKSKSLSPKRRQTIAGVRGVS